MAETEDEETQVMTSKKADIIFRRPRSNRIKESKKMEGSKSSKNAEDIETMTLAEIQMLTKKKKKLKLKETEKKSNASRPKRPKIGNPEIKRNGKFSNDNDLNIIAVEDSDFYDFDRDREERSFKKGQVWALYDDDDGMPRLYGLIAEIASVKPFEVKINWLDLHTYNNNNGDESLISWEKTMGVHISCGRFKLGKSDSLYSLNIFSHIVNAERAAREVYWIYPEKGSIWALYNSKDSVGNGNKRCYEIIVFLTSYSEIYGLSFGYLEKVDGFKTLFKRKEIGCNAIKWVEKGDFQLFSHEIPARKLAESDSKVPKDCWELDPASLPPEFLSLSSYYKRKKVNQDSPMIAAWSCAQDQDEEIESMIIEECDRGYLAMVRS
ncbi:uncharacterized protein LOC124924485 [Impatiens glandulifera]|uniref:uncharacterized protein LOC124924485 n=1 Tax=Impatiens glandulifera TaxID=253017 RepID=UPI001FB157AB|nr:uncharacterized protein LOC124924485 [Impatiens glandulifera]